MSKLFLFISFLFIQNTFGQVTFVIDNLPESTPKNASIYISGDFEGWRGGQEVYKLVEDNGTYSITLPKEESVNIRFKFTLGSWETVETNIDGSSIENRTHVFGKEKEIVKIHIENWGTTIDKISTASKNVSVLSEEFEIPQLDRKRKVWLYLPPDYETSNKKYPVIYMHDGQNIFDEKTSGFGEWQVDETLNKLFDETGFGAIVIGIEHGGNKRIDEYTPWVNPEYGGGEGEAYLEFLVETLKPYVDTNYRTISDKENTAIIGSSLGGLISHYAGLKYSEVFGLIGVYSPTFWFSDLCYDFATNNSDNTTTKMCFLAGDNESETMVDNMNKMIELMKEYGFSQENIKSKVVKNGEHNEKLWRENFEETILWLFNKD